jgi:hypothetical protein
MSYKTLHRNKNPLKSSGELRYSGMVSISSWDGGTGPHTNQSICIYLQFPHSLFIFLFRFVQFRFITRTFGLVNGVLRHFQQFVSYFVEASFIGVWNWNTQGKPPTCRKSLTKLYHIMLYRVHLANGHKTQNEDKQK